MDERVLQFRVGVVVVASVIITGILTMLFGELPSVVSGRYVLYITFPEAPGVSIDTPVRKSGVLIGRVSNVELVDSGKGVVVTVDLDRKYSVFQNEVCRIRSGSLLGDSILEFVRKSDRGASDNPIPEGSTIAGEVAGDPLRVLVELQERVEGTLDSFQSAGDEVGQLARNMNSVVGNNQAQFQRIMQKSEDAMDNFQTAMSTINEIMSDQELKDRLKQSMQDLPMLIQESRQTLAGLQRMSQLAENNLANVQKFTQPLSERGERMVADIGSSIGRLDELLAQLVQFSRALNTGEGTLGQLIRNPDLYQKLNRAAENIEEATGQLRPIIADARIFADKIARDPGGELGVRGALQRRASGTKFVNPGGAGWGFDPSP